MERKRAKLKDGKKKGKRLPHKNKWPVFPKMSNAGIKTMVPMEVRLGNGKVSTSKLELGEGVWQKEKEK